MTVAIQRFTLATLLITATAFWTPWWGTIVVALVLAYFSGFSTGLLATASFAGWLAAVVIRDFSNEHGPSRTLVRVFSLSALDSPFAQLVVIGLIALIGAFLAGSAAGLVNTAKQWSQKTNQTN